MFALLTPALFRTANKALLATFGAADPALYYAASNPVLSRLGRVTLDRILAAH